MTTLQEQPRPVEDHWCPNRDKPSPGGDDCLICARWWRDNCPSCPAYRSKWEEAERLLQEAKPRMKHGVACDSWTKMPDSEERGQGDFDGAQFCDQVHNFLAPFGLSIFNTYCNGDWPLEKALEYFVAFNKDVPVILTGRPRFHSDPAHSVVALNGRIVHDPSGAGIIGPSGDWWHFDVVALRARLLGEVESNGKEPTWLISRQSDTK